MQDLQLIILDVYYLMLEALLLEDYFPVISITETWLDPHALQRQTRS